MSSRNGSRRHATLYDFRDLDLMLKIEDEGDQDGWIEAAVLAESLGFGEEVRPVAQRLSWMRRYGMLDRHQDSGEWRLTEGGLRVIEARLKAAQTRTIEKLPDESMVEVMANITSRYRHGGGLIASLLRREFLYGTSRRL
jgi:hypothetical protein